MPVLGITCHFGPSEGLNGHPCILELEVWCDVDGIVGHSQGIWPEIWCDGTGPPVVRMDEHCVRHFLKVPDPFLSNAVLVMRCDSSKGETLSLLSAQLPPGVGGEDPVVCMVMLDGDPMFLTIFLKCNLAFHGVS